MLGSKGELLRQSALDIQMEYIATVEGVQQVGLPLSDMRVVGRRLQGDYWEE
jgi:hypothetical protein